MKRINLSLLLTLLFIVLVMLIKTNGINEFDTSIGKGLYTVHDQPLILTLEWIGMLGSTVGIISILFFINAIIYHYSEKLCRSSYHIFIRSYWKCW